LKVQGIEYLPLESNAITISLKWLPLLTGVERGGETIITYNLQWDDGSNGVNWSDVQGTESIPSLATSAQIVTNHLVIGTNYKFRLRALNIHGWSDYSNVFTVLHSFVTSKPLAPVVTMDNLYVKISWTEPANLNSAPVLAYRVKIADSTGFFREEIAYCNGALDQVRQQKYCLVHMTVLRGGPYLLTYATLVRAKVSALNINGWSEESEANTLGATIQTEPQQMPSPSKGALTL